MKHIIIGAGATYAEARNLGIPGEDCPPLMANFARKTWVNYTPHPILEKYLFELGYEDLGNDPRELFYKLEEEGSTNIELFMEYLWNNRYLTPSARTEIKPPGYISGGRVLQVGAKAVELESDEEFWQNFLYHGIGGPFQFCMIQCFHENGLGWKDFSLSKTVAKHLNSGDLVLNLNYDTVFELALQQLSRQFSYAPSACPNDELVVCKPHGSLNLVTNNQGFVFGQPEWLGLPQPSGYLSYSGFMPPRLNKKYDQHPLSKIMIQSVKNRQPEELIFWGVGLTNSDTDLVELYTAWSTKSPVLTVINPDKNVAEKIGQILKLPVHHFDDVVDWQFHQP